MCLLLNGPVSDVREREWSGSFDKLSHFSHSMRRMSEREAWSEPREENDTRKDIEVARRLSSVVVEIKKLMNGNGVAKTSDSLT